MEDRALKIVKNSDRVVSRVYQGKQVIPSSEPKEEKVHTLVDIGAMIKYKRTMLGLSIKKTASMCNMSDKTLQSIEKGSESKTSNVLRLIMMLGLNMEIKG